jgi:haloalkane dehalogenase
MKWANLGLMIAHGADWRDLYPFASRELRLDGWRYHYLDEGQGEPVLLVHGNPTWSFYWRELIKALRPRYRMLAPDHIGCGLSDKPQDYPYRLAQHISNLRKLIEELDLRGITLVAHDWGGAIGLGAAVQMPERFARFVLLNTAAFRSDRCPWRIRLCRTPLVGRLAVQGLNAFARAAISMAVERRERMTPAVRAGLLAPYDRWANRIATHRFVLDIPLRPDHPSYQTLTEVEAGLAQFRQHPAMLIWGMRDWCFTPYFLDRFRNEFFPYAVVHEVADAGHYVVEDAHERIVPWLDQFIKGSCKVPSTPCLT